MEERRKRVIAIIAGILVIKQFREEGAGSHFQRRGMGKKFFLVHDPRHGLQRLIDAGMVAPEELEEINHLCIDLGQPLFEAKPAPEPIEPPANSVNI